MALRHFRAHQRFQVDLPVVANARGRALRVGGYMVDVGLGGGACVLDEPLRLGEEVALVVAGEPATEIIATVAWVGWGEATAARVGFQFADDALGKIADLLERVLPHEGVGT
jgi:hypothetical protein